MWTQVGLGVRLRVMDVEGLRAKMMYEARVNGSDQVEPVIPSGPVEALASRFLSAGIARPLTENSHLLEFIAIDATVYETERDAYS